MFLTERVPHDSTDKDWKSYDGTIFTSHQSGVGGLVQRWVRWLSTGFHFFFSYLVFMYIEESQSDLDYVLATGYKRL